VNESESIIHLRGGSVEAGGGCVQAGRGRRLLACEEEIVREGPALPWPGLQHVRAHAGWGIGQVGPTGLERSGMQLKVAVPIISIENKRQEKTDGKNTTPLIIRFRFGTCLQHKTCVRKIQNMSNQIT
jgi:hypothetical protein